MFSIINHLLDMLTRRTSTTSSCALVARTTTSRHFKVGDEMAGWRRGI
jgi:hypothetical protein